jgi:hypothetical protein
VAFAKADWYEADKLTLRSAWKMMLAFVRNKPYPTAPFSALYLFGNIQYVGFQQAIGNSPRQRHHVRFWPANLGTFIDPTDVKYWSTKHEVNPDEVVIWFGAATKDTGFSIKGLTYQFTHSIDPNVDEEREYILTALRNARCIDAEQIIDMGKLTKVKYISDGQVKAAHITLHHTN